MYPDLSELCFYVRGILLFTITLLDVATHTFRLSFYIVFPFLYNF